MVEDGVFDNYTTTFEPANITLEMLNESEEERANRFLQVYVLFTLAVFGFIGNTTIIIILIRKRVQERCFTNINFLILQLALSDFLVVSFCLFADAIWKATYSWLAGDFMCRFVKYMQMFSLYTSTFIIVTISLDRCIAILCPFTRFDQHQIVKKLVIFAWVLAAACSIPQAFIFSLQKAPYIINNMDDFHQCVTFGNYNAEWQEPAYVVFTFTMMFFIPLLVIVPNYILISVRINRESKLGQPPSSGDHPPVRAQRLSSGSFSAGHRREVVMRKARVKALCISLIVIATFVVCWTPYYVCMIYYVIVSKNPESAQNMFQIIFFFGMSNSCINPLLYGAFHMAQRWQQVWRKWLGRTRAGSTLRGLGEYSSHREHTLLSRTDTRVSSTSSRRVSFMESSIRKPYYHQVENPRRQSSVVVRSQAPRNPVVSL